MRRAGWLDVLARLAAIVNAIHAARKRSTGWSQASARFIHRRTASIRALEFIIPTLPPLAPQLYLTRRQREPDPGRSRLWPDSNSIRQGLARYAIEEPVCCRSQQRHSGLQELRMPLVPPQLPILQNELTGTRSASRIVSPNVPGPAFTRPDISPTTPRNCYRPRSPPHPPAAASPDPPLRDRPRSGR